MEKIFNKIINRETISYIIFGVLTTAVDYAASYILFYRIGFSEIVSNTIAWVIAVAFAYITNKLFVFESKNMELKAVLREICSFAGARAVTLVITDIFLVFAGWMQIPFLIAKLLISVVVILLNYFFSKLFIFKKKANGGKNE